MRGKAWLIGFLIIPVVAYLAAIYSAITDTRPTSFDSNTEMMSVAELRKLSLDLYDIKPGYLYIHAQAGPMTRDLLERTASEQYADYIESLPRFSGYQSIWSKTTYEFAIHNISRTILTNQALAFDSERAASSFLPKYQKFYSFPLNPIPYKQFADETIAYYSKRKVGRFTYDVYHVLIRQNNLVLVVQYERAPVSDDMRELDDYVSYLAYRMEIYSPD